MRFGAPPDSSLVARKLLETRMITVAAPAYLKAHGRPRDPHELASHSCILVRDSLTGGTIEDWQFRNGRKHARVRISGRLMVADFGTLLGACVGGVGIARVNALGVQHLLGRGELMAILPGWLGESDPLYIYMTSRRLPAAKVRAFITFLQGLIVRT